MRLAGERRLRSHRAMLSEREQVPVNAAKKYVDRRRDGITRAIVNCNVMTKEAERLPEGPEKSLACAAVARLRQDIAVAFAERKKVRSASQSTGWSDEYFYP